MDYFPHLASYRPRQLCSTTSQQSKAIGEAIRDQGTEYYVPLVSTYDFGEMRSLPPLLSETVSWNCPRNEIITVLANVFVIRRFIT